MSIGQEKPISIAVKQIKDRMRYTNLKQRLISFSSEIKYPLFSSQNQSIRKVPENKNDDYYSDN